MTEIHNQMINDYQTEKHKLIEKIIKKTQHNENMKMNPNYTRHDKIKCVICGITYTKSIKCLHIKSKCHKKCMKQIFEI